MDLVPVKVINLSLSHLGFVVVLGSDGEDRTLPIFIGAPEAQAIAMVLNTVEIPRPMTHDLCANIVRSLGCSVAKVSISDLLENTFYARIYFEFIETPSDNFDIDARPSDAIALGLRFGAPLYVARHVMDQAGVVTEQEGHEKSSQSSREPSALEILQSKLQDAIREERYEEAVRLRDEINELRKKIDPN